METIINIIKKSINKYDVLKKLNWDTKTYGYRKLNRYIKENNIDVSHFETRQEQYNRTKDKVLAGKTYTLDEILISDSKYSNIGSLKRRLYNEGLKKPICEKCGQDEWWRGEKISLILDHINGKHYDNRIENLRIVCPNCEASLPTHCRNINRKKKTRKLSPDDKLTSRKNQSINARVINRPSYEQLQNDINELGFSASGRKYGVSDNAVRKWIRFYEKYK